MKRAIRNRGTILVALLAVFLMAAPILAQTTGTLIGRVTDNQDGNLPGVQVSANSPNLQGTRTAITGVNGDYKIAFLPAGTYAVTYELDGFNTAAREVKIPAAQSVSSDITLELSTVTEVVNVTGQYATISENNTGAQTITSDEVDALPIARTLNSTALLAPGTSDGGLGTTISGAMSFENLFLINGVVMNENIRGQAFDLFIEDAIQETTVSASGISAEYGRFSGGVVTAVTKSGGNRFSGSARVSATNDKWVGTNNDLSADRLDDIIPTYEVTLGGFFVKDHLWFFGAGRDTETSENQTTRATVTDAAGRVLNPIPFTRNDTETRYEAKLTGSPHPNHSIVASTMEIDEVQNNQGSFTFIDLRSLNNRKLPQELLTANYTGILTPKFFLEAQYSERQFLFEDSGGKTRDLLEGTLMRRRGTSHRYHAATFCGAGPPDCPPEERSNENKLLKASYFMTTESAGTHDLTFGFDTFDDIRFSINRQTGTDFTVWASDILVNPGTGDIFSQFTGTSTWIGWWAVFNEDFAQPTNFTTNSYYVNDRWELNNKVSLNLGVRYDSNDGQNSSGVTTASDDKFSPRLGLSYDVKGDGDLVVNASVASYVAGIANSQADQTSTGGAIGLFLSQYGGPTVNTNTGCVDTNSCVSTSDALGILFDWYFANGGTTNVASATANPGQIPLLFYTSIPGVTSIVPDTLQSPAANELTVGFTKRLGNKGLVRSDLVFRKWNDFYSSKTEVGRTTPDGNNDVVLVGNFDDGYSREYRGLHSQFRYRLTDRLNFAANYTLSELEGNLVGETGNSGPVSGGLNLWPEYAERRWTAPTGKLFGDQTHRIRAWAIYDIVQGDRQHLSVSWLENYNSGTPYGVSGTIDPSPFVTNPGYVNPQVDSTTYFFTNRDAFRTDDIHRTDLSLNYSFRWKAFGSDMEVFLQPEILNVFNESGVIDVFTGVATAESAASTCSGGCQAFNPFTATPVEGVNFAKRAGFGEPSNENDYQLPRTYRFSVGFRF